MADEKITIDGEQYISSGRAAKLVGYTKDYVGQLARAGKIKATRVGRNWYINEESISKHKVTVHYTLTKPKKKKGEENTNAEKTSKNIVNSTNINRDNSQKVDTESTETVVDRDVALFPKPQKPKRDPLVESDIRYEQHEVIRAEKHDRQERNEKVFNKSAVDPISIRNTAKRVQIRDVRKKTPSLQTRQRSTTNTGNPAIDGIVLSKKPQETVHARSYPRTDRQIRTEQPKDMRGIIEPKRKQRAPVVPVKEVEEIQDNYVDSSENSKVFPVVGAIVIFTIVMVIYILFFMGS